MKKEKKGFFSEITDGLESSTYVNYATFLLGVIILWVYVAIPSQEKNAIIYLFMLICWVIGVFADQVFQTNKRENLVQVNGLGKNPLIALAIGIVIAFLIGVFQPQGIIKPLAIVSPSVLSFLFIVVAAPYVEASFFRGTIQPILKQVFERIIHNGFVAGVVATVVQCFAFAWFHINIFGATGSWIPYFVFGVIATIGVYVFRSIGFEYGLHGINNLIAWVIR